MSDRWLSSSRRFGWPLIIIASDLVLDCLNENEDDFPDEQRRQQQQELKQQTKDDRLQESARELDRRRPDSQAASRARVWLHLQAASSAGCHSTPPATL